MNKLLKNAFVLFAVTFAAGITLGGVYEITRNVREEKELEKQIKAYQNVMPDASSFAKLNLDKEGLISYISDKGLTDKQVEVESLAEGKDASGNVVGYAVTVTDKEGYGGNIRFTVGILADGSVKGMSILEMTETAGLGMKAAEDDFLNQFKDKKVDAFSYTKTGAARESEIDAIGGATITTNAMVNGTNAALYCCQFLTGAGNEVER